MKRFCAISILAVSFCSEGIALEINFGKVKLPPCPNSSSRTQSPEEALAKVIITGKDVDGAPGEGVIRACVAQLASTLNLSLLATNPKEVNTLFRGRLDECLQQANPRPIVSFTNLGLELQNYCRTDDIEVQLQRTLAPFKQRRDFLVTPDLPADERLARAYEEYEVPPEDRKAIAFLNAPIFGSGDQGMIVTGRALYYRTSVLRSKGPQVGVIPLDEFPKRNFETGFLEVLLGNDQAFDTSGSGLRPDRLVAILNDIKELILRRNASK